MSPPSLVVRFTRASLEVLSYSGANALASGVAPATLLRDWRDGSRGACGLEPVLPPFATAVAADSSDAASSPRVSWGLALLRKPCMPSEPACCYIPVGVFNMSSDSSVVASASGAPAPSPYLFETRLVNDVAWNKSLVVLCATGQLSGTCGDDVAAVSTAVLTDLQAKLQCKPRVPRPSAGKPGGSTAAAVVSSLLNDMAGSASAPAPAAASGLPGDVSTPASGVTVPTTPAASDSSGGAGPAEAVPVSLATAALTVRLP